ncbi:MAG TPA: rhomboid family intramembrane serine protease [Candidatus Acidoferrum sp.]|nr:rhomboid family intramembrane serine protease [Candidatus Acidoferrum sp.]
MFLLPINNDLDADNRPWAVIGLIALNSAILIATYAFGNSQQVFLRYGFVPAHPGLLALFTSMLLHAGFWHLAGNSWFLWMFGKQVEKSTGPWLFLALYALCGLGGSFLHALFNSNSSLPCVGASGAISGIAGLFLILFPTADCDLVFYFGWIRLARVDSNAKTAVGAWIGEQALLGILSQAVDFSTTAFWAHVGGFIVGLLAGLAFKGLIPLDKDGLPIERPWFIPAEPARKPSQLTELDIN